MHDGWAVTTFGEAFNIQQGKTLAINKLKGGEYPVYGANGVVGYFDEYNFDFPVTGLGCRGSCGTIYHINEKAFLANNVMAIWEKDSSRIESRFIPLALTNVDLVASGAISGQVQPQITKQGLEPVPIKIPPLPEQKRIVDLISSVDAYIEALQQQLDCAKRSRNAVLHEFMNGEGTVFEHTQLGQIAEFLNGKAYSKDELLAVGKYRVLRVGNFFSNNNWYWSDLELEPNKYCENGDLLYAWSASFGPRIWKEEKVIYHYHIWKVNPDESQVDKRWLFYWLEDDVERIKSASGSGSIMMHVTKSEIEKRAIRLPTLSEQSRQVVTLEGFDRNICTLETLIVSTNQLRSSMLSDLLSGEHEIPASYDQVMGAA
jgi:type I restriction enzyme S subunit